MKMVLRILAIVVILSGIWYYSGVAAKKGTDAETIVSEMILYEKCGHKEGQEYPVPEKAVGLSGKDVAKVLNREYESFENNRLCVKSVDEGYCHRHYRTFLDGNAIKTEIIKTGELVSEYPTAPSQYSYKDLELLRAGIITDSPAELSALLEDYTS